MHKRAFLTAEWRHLVMLNYAIDPAVLQPLVPRGTALDTWEGRHYVSLVGFLFLKTKVLGIPIPFHRNFEEVNLRFYVRRKAEDGWRRGVVFVKEIVPRAAIAFVARTLYNENYVALAMDHEIARDPDGSVGAASYRWWASGRAHALSLAVTTPLRPLVAGSEEEFITEHYWGYTAQRDGGTIEYQVTHPSWSVASGSAGFDGDVRAVYGEAFASSLSVAPGSAFLADGSPITVSQGARIR